MHECFVLTCRLFQVVFKLLPAHTLHSIYFSTTGTPEKRPFAFLTFCRFWGVGAGGRIYSILSKRKRDRRLQILEWDIQRFSQASLPAMISSCTPKNTQKAPLVYTFQVTKPARKDHLRYKVISFCDICHRQLCICTPLPSSWPVADL